MTDARTEILSRIRGALGSADSSAGAAGTTGAAGTAGVTRAPSVVPREYRSAGEHAPGSDAVLEVLIDRLVDYKAEVHRTTPKDLPRLLARLIPQRSAERQVVGSSDYRSPDVLPTTPSTPRGAVVVPHGIDQAWVSAMGGVEVRTDSREAPLSAAELDEVDAVVTAARVAVAETGTIVLDGEADQGRRAVSLVPDVHVCVVRTDQVVQTVPEAVRLLGADPERPLTWISGPSATSDIELERVEGVHGPRTLHVVLLS
ncbi:LutC/YkgG family protein [Promicromonospora iranensis]|uniref:L-lactate dehydrogenase complex protein LldG n=1 Tax=Promicromonospora iranensis TaxID=1105144 RepID=A0ABU2CNA1_9MICO|nr:LUD domain-containing protein [Promicromonospora iranensis]MDR7382815.1 L-lactate dehydrogenase complex protein LldG [Promicromonospora iranensis]